jgi:uncharacterized protein YwbE
MTSSPVFRVLLVLGVACSPATEARQLPPSQGQSATADTLLYFNDDFAHGGQCGKARGAGGFGWGEAQTGDPDSVLTVRDPVSPSGCALAFVFGGSADPADDAWAEQRFKLGKVRGEALRELFVGFVLATPANYVHRDAKGPDNNKILRLWDQNYSGSVVHLGMSALRRSNGSGSQLTVEFKQDGHTGNYNTGPWSPILTPSKADTIGFYVRTSSGVNVPDGVIRVWWNRVLKYEHTNLRLASVAQGPGYNGLGNGYLLGWANSGFDQRTEFHVWRFLLAPTPLPWFLPPTR